MRVLVDHISWQLFGIYIQRHLTNVFKISACSKEINRVNDFSFILNQIYLYNIYLISRIYCICLDIAMTTKLRCNLDVIVTAQYVVVDTSFSAVTWVDAARTYWKIKLREGDFCLDGISSGEGGVDWGVWVLFALYAKWRVFSLRGLFVWGKTHLTVYPWTKFEKKIFSLEIMI